MSITEHPLACIVKALIKKKKSLQKFSTVQLEMFPNPLIPNITNPIVY